jgi:predicted transcriptional regulator
MRRTTVLLDDDLADQLEYERRRRNESTAMIIREALTEYLAGGKPRRKRLAFAALGRSRYPNTARDMEEILAREWTYEKVVGRPDRKKPTKSRRRR